MTWYNFILISGAAALVLFGNPHTASAQGISETTVHTAGSKVNLFRTLDPAQPINGAVLKLPPEWTLQEVRLLRYGTEPVAFQRRPHDESGAYLLATDRAITGPHEFVIRVQLPERAGTFEWGLHPFVWRKAAQDSTEQSQVRRVGQTRGRVDLKAASPPDRGNQALDLSAASSPLFLRADQLPQLGRVSSFTIEFWMQTNGLDEVVLSTWNGNEAVAYPAEFVVDRSGRLRFYSGQPGQHQALRTGRPVADGTWHHVATVYDAERSRLRLFVDGRVADSLRGQMPVSPGPVPMALGGRLNREMIDETDRQPLFSGRLDELRIWQEARSVGALRRMKSRSLRLSAAEQADRRLLRLGFEPDEQSVISRWPNGAQRTPVHLSFQSGLRNLRAETDGRSVTLRWVSEAADGQSFVVERSANGDAFTPVAELSPSTAERATSTDVPGFVYTDQDVPGQVVYYRIRQQQADGRERTSGTIKIGLGASEDDRAPVELIGNFPNPFSETTTIAYEVRTSQPVTLTVWDLKGVRVRKLASGTKAPGYHEASFSAADLTSGTYFVRLETPNGTQSHRMVVLK